jgi:hypothetical protein
MMLIIILEYIQIKIKKKKEIKEGRKLIIKERKNKKKR